MIRILLLIKFDIIIRLLSKSLKIELSNDKKEGEKNEVDIKKEIYDRVDKVRDLISETGVNLFKKISSKKER